MNRNWQKSWHEFILAVASLANDGKQGAELAAPFSGREVSWQGVVTENESDQEYAPSLVFEMPLVECRLLNNRILRADWLSVLINEDLKDKSRRVIPGTPLQFHALISSHMPVTFAQPVELHLHDSDHFAHVQVCLTMVFFNDA